MKKVFAFFLIIVICLTGQSKISATGSATIVMEATTRRVLFEKNIHTRNLTASIVKILTALIAIEQGNLFEIVTVPRDVTLVEGSKIYLQEDDELLLIDLVYGLMLRSGNDAATLISQVVFGSTELFVAEMNRYARVIGMKHSTFENPTGLDATSKNYSTAYDMALLMAYAMENEAFRLISCATSYRCKTKNQIYQWSNKHRLVGKQNVISGKTGYTKQSGRTLVSYFEKEEKKLICVTFQVGGDFHLHSALFDKYQKAYQFYPILKSKVFPQKLEGLQYYPYLEKDIVLPLTPEEVKELSVALHLKQVCDSDCGKIKVYASNKLIYEQTIGYYPLVEGI